MERTIIITGTVIGAALLACACICGISMANKLKDR